MSVFSVIAKKGITLRRKAAAKHNEDRNRKRRLVGWLVLLVGGCVCVLSH